jgi:hypothetical protein
MHLLKRLCAAQLSNELDGDEIRAHTAALQSFQEILRQRMAEKPAKDSAEYVFRNTITYWIAVTFIEGSVLFAIGETTCASAPRIHARTLSVARVR